MKDPSCLVLPTWAIFLALWASWAAAQEARDRSPFQPLPPVVSPEVSVDRQVTFRIRAASADMVRLEGSDIPNLGRGVALTKGDGGVWECTIGPLDPRAYRYNFDVDGGRVMGSRRALGFLAPPSTAAPGSRRRSGRRSWALSSRWSAG